MAGAREMKGKQLIFGKSIRGASELSMDTKLHLWSGDSPL